MSLGTCCLKAFRWEGTPTGREEKYGSYNVYITGTSNDRAILFVSDVLGWTFPNSRLLADHYAEEVGATVYLPDFFHDDFIPHEPACAGRYDEIDIDGFMTRNSREIREPEVFEVARSLRSQYKNLGAVGICYGGWAVVRLGAKEHQPPLVDCVAMAHPGLLTNKDIDELGVPIQIIAPEIDPVYPPELKLYTFQTLQKTGIPFDYQHFPGMEHIFAVRGDLKNPGERAAMLRAKNAVVAWMNQHMD